MKNFRSKLNRGKRLTVGDPAVLDGNTLPQRVDTLASTAETTVRSENTSGTSTPWNEAVPVVEEDVQETPEAAAQRLVRLFCTGDPDDGDAEVVLLPSIVEAAESSPQAAAECARHIRKFMYREHWARPNLVYNAITLMRILAANPATSFTRHMDRKFVDTVREILRTCTSSHVVHFLIETLREFEARPVVDEGMGRMLEMWQKEEAKSQKVHAKLQEKTGGRPSFWSRQQEQSRLQQQHQQPTYQPAPQQPYYAQQQHQPILMSNPMGSVAIAMAQQPMPQWVAPPQLDWTPYPQQQQQLPPPSASHDRSNRSGRSSGRSGGTSALPKPRDLRKRLEEAKTTAGVLADVVNTTTSPDALLRHDLVYDLCARCTRASTQVLEYLMTASPLPDNDEMAALLTTQEVLHQSLQHFHRAVLDARRGLGICEERRASDGSNPAVMTSAVAASKGKAAAPQSPGVVMGAGGPGEDGIGVSSGSGSGTGTGRNGHGSSNEQGRRYGGHGHDRFSGSDNDDHDNDDNDYNDYDRNDRAAAQKEEEEMLAAAIAASTAPGANGRGGRRPGGGGGGGGSSGAAGGSGSSGYPYEHESGGGGGSASAAAVDNPFHDTVQAGGSSRSSSVVRPGRGGGGGSSSKSAAMAGGSGSGSGSGSGMAYVDSDDNLSDEEYLKWQRSRKKAAAKAPSYGAGGSAGPASSSTPTWGSSSSSSTVPAMAATPPPDLADERSSIHLPSRPVLDAAASSSSGAPIYRY